MYLSSASLPGGDPYGHSMVSQGVSQGLYGHRRVSQGLYGHRRVSQGLYAHRRGKSEGKSGGKSGAVCTQEG